MTAQRALASPDQPDLKEAAARLKSANRILVIGCSGGGKTTLSVELCRLLGLPFVSMDRDFFWQPGWVKRQKAEERTLIASKVAEVRWLMDGTGPSTFDLRLPRTDVLIWVRVPRWQCLWGICSRGMRYFGRRRPDMAPGCVEKFPDFEFLSYIWHFESRFVPKIDAGLKQYGSNVPVFQLKTRRDMRRLLDLLDPSA